MSMDQDNLNKVMEIASNASKVAANLTNGSKHQPQEKKVQENMNQPHTQTVEVKVGEQGNSQKPMILKEKSETHIHKTFPDNRELNEKECEIEKLRLQNEHELKMKELEFRMRQEEENRRERKERIEYERKEAERRREKDRKFMRRLGIGAAVLAVAGVGISAFDIYTNSRNPAGKRVAVGEPQAVTLAPEEGSVK